MSNGVHPFAGGGGGTLFEYKVATLLAADLILSRHTEHGGVVAAVEMQTGTMSFDDLKVSIELMDGGNRTVCVQCRYKQPFTASNGKFAKLIKHAAAAVFRDEVSFATGEKRLSVIVNDNSPGHDSMTALCELSRDSGDFSRFVSVVGAHRGKIKERWEHCLKAAGDLEPEKLHQILSALEVRAVYLGTETSRDWVDLINRLADLWTPHDLERAQDLRNALFEFLSRIGPKAGKFDLNSLQSGLGSKLPSTIGANTRREKLNRRRNGGHQRVVSALETIGLNTDEAGKLATSVLDIPSSITPAEPLTVVSGEMGVGKTTELERIHRHAIDQALEDPSASIPILLHAREVSNVSLKPLLSKHVSGLGDPSRVGVHLIIDGLDEAGVQIADLTSRIASLKAEWPNSTVILGTRPQPIPNGLENQVVKPLTQEATVSLVSSIYPGITSTRLKWLREELSEVLRRPLFAIRYALDCRSGNRAGTNLGQLVNSVGQHALNDIADAEGGTFDLLGSLACRIVDSGGQMVEARDLTATPLQIVQLKRLRIVHVSDGKMSFQLAVLTEWFAAHAILRDLSILDHCVSTPLLAHRWRYVFIQALLNGAAGQVDDIMTELLTHAPATASWVLHEAETSSFKERSTSLGVGVPEAGARIRKAAKAWIEPWSDLTEQWTDDGELPTLGISLDDQYLSTAWLSEKDDSSDQVVSLPTDVNLFCPTDSPWTGFTWIRLTNSEAWPWDWARTRFKQDIDGLFKNRGILADIELCWPELAWDYAHRMLGKGPAAFPEPVQRVDLEAVIAQFSDHPARDEVHGKRGNWVLSEGRKFVADLTRLDINEVKTPWPPGNVRETKAWPSWTTRTLLARLQQATKTALDIYQVIVERHLPSMAQELNTYQLLPGRIVGSLTLANSNKGFEGTLLSKWHIEPLPMGSENEAQWSVGETGDRFTLAGWETQKAKLQVIRSDIFECVSLHAYREELEVSSSTPASSLALRLLENDLSEFEWVTGPRTYYRDIRGARPRYT